MTDPYSSSSFSSSPPPTTSSASSTSSKEPFVTESMVINALTKTQPDKYKADYKMGSSYQAPQSTSFINK